MSFEDWQRSGWLVAHHPDAGEIADLIAVVDRDLVDCRSPGLSADWRFNIAYNAILQAATAALAAAGYRAGRDSHHYRVLQSLAMTIGLEQPVLRQLDAFRKKRNLTGYERIGAVSDKEVNEVIETAIRIRQRVLDWMRQTHADLL